MRTKNTIFICMSLVISVFLLFVTGCKKDKDVIPLPTISTIDATNVDIITAGCGGNITSDGGSLVTVRGVCWSTGTTPTIADSKTTDGAGVGSFTSSLTGLQSNTTYYVRAYATNNGGTAYGGTVSFTTRNGMIDADGNVYHVVTIGAQTWTVENLKTTKYNDGTAIPLVTEASAWANLTTPGFCWYNNNEALNKNTYGGLYNWYAVNTGKLAPTGWHVATDAEWTTLTDYLGGASYGGKLKETGTVHWIEPNTGATNETGFTALPAGSRDNTGIFDNLGYYSIWWSSTEISSTDAWYLFIYSPQTQVQRFSIFKKDGFSIRCIKD